MTRTPKRALIVLLAGAALLLISGSRQAPSAKAAFSDTDGDGVTDQAEAVFGSNPNDAASTPEAAGATLSFLLPNKGNRCSDGVDNDLDGLTDDADPTCTDSDDDGVPDTVEQMLGSDPRNDSSVPENARVDNLLLTSIYPLQLCNDGEDDDRDGLTDVADPGCNQADSDEDGFDDVIEKSLGSDWLDAGSVPEHASLNPGSCSDGIDNDHDGATDGADQSCVTITNDNIGNATVVGTLPFEDATKTLGATVESAEPMSTCAIDHIEGTVWYSFMAQADMPVVIDTSGSDFATVVSVWTTGQAGYSRVTCNNSFFINPSMRFAFQATHGVTYKIQVGRNSRLFPGAGALTIHMEAGVIPPNDNFADAATISAIPSSATADIVAATVEAHEPASTCTFGSQVHSTGSILNTIWFRYVPANDTYVRAELSDSPSAGSLLGVYRGATIDGLTQVACSGQTGISTGPELAFFAEAGQHYYFQVGLDGFFGNLPAGKQGSPAGPTLSGSPQPTLNLTTFAVPSCPAPQFTVPDTIGDSFGEGAADIRSILGGFTGHAFCVTATFDRPVDTSSFETYLSVDTDLNRQTNDGSFGCGQPSGVGIDVFGDVRADEGLLMRVERRTRNNSKPLQSGTAMFSPTALSITVPIADLGDESFRFALMLTGEHNADCTPDGGSIGCAAGACAFSPFRNGDANCNGAANAIDAAIVLQASAGLLPSIACPDAADINENGHIDSLDAALILQFSAGLLHQLPPR